MIFTNVTNEVNKYIGGLGSWFPTQLYLGICSGLSPININASGQYTVNNELNISGYSRIPITSSLWNIKVNNTPSAVSLTNYNGLISIGPYDQAASLVQYFVTDTPSNGGTLISYGNINTNLAASTPATLSGLNIPLINSTSSTLDAGFVYTSVLTSSGQLGIQKHYLGISPIATGPLTLNWMGLASGIWGITTLPLLQFNETSNVLFSSGTIFHSFTIPSPTGYIFFASISVNETRYIDYKAQDAGIFPGLGPYINQVTNCGSWFSSTKQAHNGIDETLFLRFIS